MTKEQVQSWQHLRHPLAHGTRPDDDQMQEQIDLTHRVQTLLYRLVAHVISYHGPLTDYGTPEWDRYDPAEPS